MHVAATTASLMKHESPKCRGCIHCKHVRIKWPEYAGRPFYNYIRGLEL